MHYRYPNLLRDYLREEMEKHETKHPGSTYSLLRVASDPYCWPSEMFEEDALHTAIVDREGRIWECRLSLWIHE